MSGRSEVAALELAAALANVGDPRAIALLEQVAAGDQSFPVLLALAGAYRREGRRCQVLATLDRLLRNAALDALQPAAALASVAAAEAGLAGWIGWSQGRLVFGSAERWPQSVRFRIGRHRTDLAWQRRSDHVWSTEMPAIAIGAVTGDVALLGAGLSALHFRTVDGAVSRAGNRLRGWVWFPHDPGRLPSLVVDVERDGRSTEIAIPSLHPSEPSAERPFATPWEMAATIAEDARDVRVRERDTGGVIEVAVEPPGSLPRAANLPRSGGDLAAKTTWLLDLCRARDCVLLVTHDEGGGVERHVQERVKALRRKGRVGILLRSLSARQGSVRLEAPPRVADHLCFDLATQAAELVALLQVLNLAKIEFHQPRRHPETIWRLGECLGVPHEVYLHDYAMICPRVTLVGEGGRYCGEPEIRVCERCAERFIHRDLFAPAGVAALRRRSAALLGSARRVVAPSHDIARRFHRHFPRRYSVRALEAVPSPRRAQDGLPARVCVVGSINRHKGFEILLACARDAAIRELPIRFTVVGHTSDDDALIEAGAFVTGPFDEAERADLIARQRPCAGFLPSIWPEPWCYALTGLLAAGLPTLCFDIGAQADRVRGAGGSVLPLETAAPAINHELIRLSYSPPETPMALV